MAGWNLDPFVVAPLLLVSALYARGVAVVWRRAGTGALVSRVQVVSFALGIYVIVVAVVSPLDALAHVLFSAHMVQHVLLMLVAAPLLVFGAPLLPILWSLGRPARLAVARAWQARPAVASAWRALTHPVVVWSVLTTTLWTWHLPGPYQAAVLQRGVHVGEHVTMLAASLLFWWVVLQPIGRRRVDGGSAVLLVFATKVQAATLGALITFVPLPLYPVYESGAAAWGMTLMQDQHLAGLIMGTVSGLVYLFTGAALFLWWLRTIERRGRAPGQPYTERVVRAPRLDLRPAGERGEFAANGSGGHDRP